MKRVRTISSPMPRLLKKATKNSLADCQKVNVEVKKSQHKYIVGPRWQGIQDILQSTGAYCMHCISN